MKALGDIIRSYWTSYTVCDVSGASVRVFFCKGTKKHASVHCIDTHLSYLTMNVLFGLLKIFIYEYTNVREVS